MSGLSSIVVNPYLILLLNCHLLSDYYFQSQKMADRKDQDKKVLGLHILYVALPLIVVSLLGNQAILLLKFCLLNINPPARRKWIRSLGLVL